MYNTIVIVLEAHEEVQKMEVVVERLLHTEEAKEKSSCDSGDDKAIMTKQNLDDTTEAEVHSIIIVRSMDILRRTASYDG